MRKLRNWVWGVHFETAKLRDKEETTERTDLWLPLNKTLLLVCLALPLFLNISIFQNYLKPFSGFFSHWTQSWLEKRHRNTKDLISSCFWFCFLEEPKLRAVDLAQKHFSDFAFPCTLHMPTVLIQAPLDENISSRGCCDDRTMSRKMTESFVELQLVERCEGKRW